MYTKSRQMRLAIPCQDAHSAFCLTKERTRHFVDFLPDRGRTYTDKEAGGTSRTHPRRLVGTPFRPSCDVLAKGGSTKRGMPRLLGQSDGSRIDVVLLAQTGGRAADLGSLFFMIDGLRASVVLCELDAAKDSLGELFQRLGAAASHGMYDVSQAGRSRKASAGGAPRRGEPAPLGTQPSFPVFWSP